MLGQRVLMIYSAVLTVILAASFLTGFTNGSANTFNEINVQRINVREADGTLRMVISNSAKLPGVIVKSKEQPKIDRPQAGMLFYNDEGSETGGLIFGGRKNANGDVVDSGGSLSFDRYNANQVVQLLGVDDKDNSMAGIAISDSQEHSQGERRLWAGRGPDGSALLSLMDAAGKKRIQISVSADGLAEIAFLDDKGQTVRTIHGETTKSAPGSRPIAPSGH
ncbi:MULTISPECIES: hypothetical protein [unclassified Dyella]|uniref:hypothetical protein n=1 Tax=unclassified Dyella TaxID=2634549 RepID=UPI000C81CCD8|nr:MULTISPECIES: hypothetical protein [unclassified Dyella]MDR3443914.1 hypothetical protein [Dyella sp.]PMQ05187.1 hypothetical protein DyAD56_10975 [Dyella sp. AD56]